METFEIIDYAEKMTKLKKDLKSNEIVGIAYKLKKSVQTIKNHLSLKIVDIVMSKAITEEAELLISKR